MPALGAAVTHLYVLHNFGGFEVVLATGAGGVGGHSVVKLLGFNFYLNHFWIRIGLGQKFMGPLWDCKIAIDHLLHQFDHHGCALLHPGVFALLEVFLVLLQFEYQMF